MRTTPITPIKTVSIGCLKGQAGLVGRKLVVKERSIKRIIKALYHQFDSPRRRLRTTPWTTSNGIQLEGNGLLTLLINKYISLSSFTEYPKLTPIPTLAILTIGRRRLDRTKKPTLSKPPSRLGLAHCSKEFPALAERNAGTRPFTISQHCEQ